MLTIESQKLLEVLVSTHESVKVLDIDGRGCVRRLAATEIIHLINQGKQFDYRATKSLSRVKWVKPLETLDPDPLIARVTQWEPCYRTEGAPALGPWAGGPPEWHKTYETQPRTLAR